MLPILTLQMLVDNAIGNNGEMKQRPLKLSIASRDQWLEVKNTIRLQDVKAAREGLELLIARFRAPGDGAAACI